MRFRISREQKVATLTSLLVFLAVLTESQLNSDDFGAGITQKIVISIGCGFTAWLVMKSWFKTE
jgi:hypothetical protein